MNPDRRRFLASVAVATGGLAGCASVGGGGEMQESATIRLNRWGPDQKVVRLVPGATATWKNEDKDPHRLESTVFTTGQRRHERATEWAFKVRVGPGETVRHSFADPGVYEYACGIQTAQHGVNTTCGAFLVGEAAQEFDRVLPCMT